MGEATVEEYSQARLCDGQVRSLAGQRAIVSGRVYLDGSHASHRECARRLRSAGAEYSDEYSHGTTILIKGDLSYQPLTDPTGRFSRKLLAVHQSRQGGQEHVHVVDESGFNDLLDGGIARCRRLRKRGGAVEQEPEADDGVLGGPLVPRKASKHLPIELARDLSELDRGTAAHEETIRRLQTYLGTYGIEARRAHRGGPQFDLGWVWRRRLYVAEVKSLGAKVNESQQIRLGLGQLLDYHVQISRRTNPVLVLEREPEDARWERLCASVGVILTFGPEFPVV